MSQFSRSEKIIGTDNLKKLKDSRVLLVGIGGVGGITLEMLVRSGIENIVVVDFDTFEESNLNRQILSLNSNVNRKKVEVAKKRVLDINPNCKINAITSKVDELFLDNLNLQIGRAHV